MNPSGGTQKRVVQLSLGRGIQARLAAKKAARGAGRMIALVKETSATIPVRNFSCRIVIR